jgi:DNA-binding XRE family transcriptional regulator
MKFKSTAPTPEMILAAREATSLSQMDAARAVGLGRYQTWAEYERGVRLIDDVRWQWFLLQFGLHPKLKLEAR